MKAADDDVKQAIGAVARLGGFTIKKIATSDDLKDRTLTVTLTRASDGWVQDHLSFEDETELVAKVNDRGEVEEIEHPDTGDPDDYNEVASLAQVATTNPTASTLHIDDEYHGSPNQPLVGELAAAAKRRK